MTLIDRNTDEARFDPGRRDPSKPAASFDADHSVLWLGDVPLPIRPGQRSNAEMLTVIAAAVRELRNLGDHDPCHLRADELATFARLLDLDDRALRIDIRRILGLSKSETGTLVGRLKDALRSS